MNQAEVERILEVPDGSFIDPRIYFSPEIYETELRHVLPRSWVLVADLQDLREPGDFVTDTIGTEPVIVVRSSDGELRAFSNVCTHRGCLLAEGTGNCGPGLACPYHGWTFKNDGRLSGVSFRKDFGSALDTDSLDLHSLPVAIWQRWVFVNVSADAGPLTEWLEDVPLLTRGHGFSSAIRVAERDDEVACNWKVLVDNGACDYHYWFVHAQTLGPAIDPGALEVDNGDTTATMYAEYKGASGFRPLEFLSARERSGSFVFSIFPNLLILAFPNGSCWLLRWTPLSIDRTRARVWIYSRDADEDPRGSEVLLERVQREDYATCERVQ